MQRGRSTWCVVRSGLVGGVLLVLFVPGKVQFVVFIFCFLSVAATVLFSIGLSNFVALMCI